MDDTVTPTQKPLNMKVRRPVLPLEEDAVARIPNAHAALVKMMTDSGLPDKTLGLELNIDAGQLSRIRSGSAHFPTSKLIDLMDITGSEALLQYLLYARGYEVKPHKRKSELERELEAERLARSEVEKRNQILMEVINGRKT